VAEGYPWTEVPDSAIESGHAVPEGWLRRRRQVHHVDTIERPAAPEAAKPNCQGVHNFNGSGFRCWCGAISID
jgi:hypothetical protein